MDLVNRVFQAGTSDKNIEMYTTLWAYIICPIMQTWGVGGYVFKPQGGWFRQSI